MLYRTSVSSDINDPCGQPMLEKGNVKHMLTVFYTDLQVSVHSVKIGCVDKYEVIFSDNIKCSAGNQCVISSIGLTG